jgi:putative ABC transport system permease protein
MLFLAQIIFRNIVFRRYSALLSILLTAFSTATVFLSGQIARESESHLDENAKGLHFVVGAKGSPLQLILSSVFHFDNPTGNISFRKADSIARSPFVETAVPLCIGDNYAGYRIIGTNHNFFSFYGLSCAEGDFFSDEMQVVLGSAAAKNLALKIGDKFKGLHGLAESEEGHEHAFVVKGILNPKNSILDNLILTPVESYWHVHEHHAEGEKVETEKEITALLVRAKGTAGALMMPNIINKNSELLAASPASEVTKLKTLISGGTDVLYYFSVGIVFIALVSILFSFLSGFRERRFDLALLRINGASAAEIIFIVVGEAVLVCLTGIFFGVAAHQVFVYSANDWLQNALSLRLQNFSYVQDDYFFALLLTLTAFLAALLPAFWASRADLTEVLKKS